MIINKSETEKWYGKHTGVDFEINHFKRKGFEEIEQDHWTYYIILYLNRIPDKNVSAKLWIDSIPDDKGRVFYSYMENEVIYNIYFHGGCTWYSKEEGFDGGNKIIKIGCDFSHYWDEGYIYNLGIVKDEVVSTIESFKKIVPDYKYWCSGNGNLYDLEDGILTNESFLSNEYKENNK